MNVGKAYTSFFTLKDFFTQRHRGTEGAWHSRSETQQKRNSELGNLGTDKSVPYKNINKRNSPTKS
ncbi:MAG: hypothetical protein FWG87_08425 [Defluviitaleaceae bacterium]|nr:hypothetical protein [Defluviitaleaceae bacterium]